MTLRLLTFDESTTGLFEFAEISRSGIFGCKKVLFC
jgi:hypothetical protein